MLNYKETPAADLYNRLRTKRDAFLRRARCSAALTIPMLVPPDGHTASNDFVDPEQSIGARGVNHLAARLLLTLLPPSAPFFRLVPDATASDVLGTDPERKAETEKVFSQIEQEVTREVETQSMRVSAVEILKHLIVAGNALMWMPDAGGMNYFPLAQYVVLRDSSDKMLALVIEEVSAPDALNEVERELALQGTADAQSHQFDSEQVSVFTKVWWNPEDGKYHVHQEINGSVVPGSEGNYIEDDLPFRPLRWTKVHAECYGRSLVEEYLGDLKAMERLTRSIVTGSLACARLLFLVNPGGTTDPEVLNEADNGQFVPGLAEDIAALQVEKFADFRVAQEQIAIISRRLEAAFLLNSSVTRDAERVTAEEIRFVAQELESALGGVYSILAQEFQLPVAQRLLQTLQKRRVIPAFSKEQKDHIKPTIVTGVEALGRGQELERVRAIFGVLQGVIGPEQLAQVTNLGPLVDFLFANGGVRIDGLIKSSEQIEQEQQQAQMMAAMQELVSKGTGPAVNAVSKASEAERAAAPEGGE